MKRTLLVLLILLASGMGARPMERQIIGSEQDHSAGGETADCQHFFSTTFTAFPETVSDQEQREIPMTGVEPQLRVDASQEGGVSVHGWNRPFAKLLVCRSAAGLTREVAQRTLTNVAVNVQSGRIDAKGPAIDATQAWWVNFILYVPRGTFVDVRARNGGIAVRNMNGRVRAFATKGGISVVQSTGKYVISTESGGITLDRVSGRAEAYSVDGAISLKVAQGQTAPKIEAHTSGSTIVCALKNCESGLGIWSTDKRALKIGGGLPDYRITTIGSSILIGGVTN
jgi:hypothetical protein